jgi:hypothetical protein
MDIDVFSARQLPEVLRALRTALNPEGALDAAGYAFLSSYASIAGGALPAAEDLPMIEPRQLRLDSAHRCKRLVQLAALAVLLRRPIRPASVRYLRELADALAVREPVLDLIQALCRGRRLRVRLLAVRRGFGVILREAYTAAGWLGVARFFAALLFRRAVDRDKHWRYKRLGLLPDGTLGREYWKHLTSLGFGFPGEPGGIPDSIAYHDVGHVLTGFDTTPAGEIQQGSFQGGSRRDDGFSFVQFVILQFHHGIRITPVAQPRTGLFDPEKVLWAIHRGASCTVDITHQWDFWPLMSLPMEQARTLCGLIPPPTRATA